MTNPEVAVAMLGIFILTILLGFPIWITLMAMGIFFGYYAYWDAERMGLLQADGPVEFVGALFNNNVFDLLVNQTYSVMANDVLTAVPLFLFMGYVVERANIVDRLFATLQIAARRLPASMAVAALATCALFATATGIIGAVVTLMGMLAFPAMLKARYDTSFSAGVICAGGTLGILIPPSIMLIVYAAAASVSVVRLYAGAILPGFLLAGLYMVYVIGRAYLNPSLAPKPRAEDFEGITRIQVVVQMLTSFFPLAFLILSVLGAILFGLATPSEAASMGAIGGLVLAVAYRIGAIHRGETTPDWMANGGRYNEWLFSLGSGAVATLLLYLAYFILRFLAHGLIDAPLPEARSFPFGPGIAIALSLALTLVVRFGRPAVPALDLLLPSSPAIRPLFAFGGQGALYGLAVAGIYLFVVGVLDPEQDFFIYHEMTWWAADVGFFVGSAGVMAWRAIDKQGLQEAVYLSVRTSAMVCWLFVGSWIFSSVFSYLGGHDLIEHWVLGMDLSPLMFLLLAQLIIFFLGWPLEWSEIIIIFVPIFLPMLPHFGIDPLFFGILVALNLQTSFLTPPMAMAAYYLKGVAPPHVQLIEIFRGVMPFLFMVFIAMILLYVFPGIALWLPTVVYGR
ncbi:MAG: TRAP transporter large permease subunit [Alphaproteobacteria bacterium]|jgi:TRAP-type mannitol/chloroaromatic compound transport system permease large subunit|nr:TRAP transporter large permease subunit [Alphaproteobacteria bacterium]MDP6812743.1 TRAP transporter large permease subunit [Alphaproteobacteria bacterium]